MVTINAKNITMTEIAHNPNAVKSLNWIQLRDVVAESLVRVPATHDDLIYAVRYLVDTLKVSIVELAANTNKSPSYIRRLYVGKETKKKCSRRQQL
jgi:hypothetical protein